MFRLLVRNWKKARYHCKKGGSNLFYCIALCNRDSLIEQSLNCVIEHTHLIASNSPARHPKISSVLFTKAKLCGVVCVKAMNSIQSGNIL